MKTVIFARVSTNIQEYDRQVNELTALANSKGWSVEAVFAEKISGAKANKERAELLNMVAYVEANAIDKVLVTELSRLGRDTFQVLEVSRFKANRKVVIRFLIFLVVRFFITVRWVKTKKISHRALWQGKLCFVND